MKQTLQNLLAEGKTAKALQSLLAITKSQDADLYNKVLQISARFAEYERQKRLGIADDAPLSMCSFNSFWVKFKGIYRVYRTAIYG